MKRELRKALKNKRELIENKSELSYKAELSFLGSELYKKCDNLLLYSSTGSEVSTDEILRAALKDGKRVAFPLCTSDNGIMEFRFIKAESDLETGMYGIKAPSPECGIFDSSENTVCVVPGISFDERGYRIGYGKGYYDRFLESFQGTSVGLCYDEMLSDSLPVDSYDKRTDYLITDKKIYNFTNKEDLKNG